MDHVAGYVVVNDISARDWQGNTPALREGEKGDGQWLRAKGSDTFLPMGPVFVTKDELDPKAGLRLRSWRIPGRGRGNRVLMQDGTTADLIFDVPELVSFISRHITLDPGDVIATGTPAGVGVFRDPPIFLEPGDRVRCEIEGIGSVENPIVDWTDDPRESLTAATRRSCSLRGHIGDAGGGIGPVCSRERTVRVTVLDPVSGSDGTSVLRVACARRVSIADRRWQGPARRDRAEDCATLDHVLALVKPASRPRPGAARRPGAADGHQRRPDPRPQDRHLRHRPPHRVVGSVGGEDDQAAAHRRPRVRRRGRSRSAATSTTSPSATSSAARATWSAAVAATAAPAAGTCARTRSGSASDATARSPSRSSCR